MIWVWALLIFSEQTPYEKLAAAYETAHQLFIQKDFLTAARHFESLLHNYRESEFADELRFRLAECYFNLSEYNRARGEFETLLKMTKASYLEPEALYALGIISVLLSDYQGAEDYLQQLLKNPAYQNEERANFAMGVLYYFRREYRSAEKKFLDLKSPEAKFYLGKTYAMLGKPLEALNYFKQVLAEVPNTPIATLAHFSSGEALFLNRDFDGAKIKFADFINYFPESQLFDYAHYFLAACLVHQKRYAEASEHFTPLTRHPNNLLAAHSNYFLGICQERLDNARSAVASFQRVRANYPNTAIASYANLQLTVALLASGDTLQALLSATQLVTMFETGELSSVGDYLSGMMYFKMKNYPLAANHFENILTTYPKSSLREPSAAMLLSTLNSEGNYEQAITVGSKYLKDFSETSEPWRGRFIFFLAEGYYYAGKFTEAAQSYLKVSKDFYGLEITPYARLGLAYCFYHEDRASEAADIFKALLAINVKDTLFTAASYLGYGYTLFNLKDYLKALDAFEMVANEFPKLREAAVSGLYYAGLSYFRLTYYGQAIESWEKLMRLFPAELKAAEGSFRAGDTYFKAAEYAKAVALFRWVVENHANTKFAISSQLAIAQSFYNERKYDESIREYQKFLDLYPTDAQATNARKGMEMCYYRKGIDSPTEMRLFVERFPQSDLAAEGQMSIAREYFTQGSFQQAADEFQRVVINFPASALAPDAQLLMAECYVNLKLWDKSADVYSRYLSYFPNHKERAAAYFNLGTSYFNLEKYDLALKNFTVVVDSFSASEYVENARFNVAVCHRKLGDETKAASTLGEYALRASEPGKKAQADLERGRIFIEKGNFKEALTIYAGIVPENDEAAAETYFMLGECYRNLGNSKGAIASYSKVKTIDLTDNQYKLKALSQLALIYEKARLISKAVEIYQAIIKSSTNDEIRNAAQTRIVVLSKKSK